MQLCVIFCYRTLIAINFTVLHLRGFCEILWRPNIKKIQTCRLHIDLGEKISLSVLAALTSCLERLVQK